MSNMPGPTICVSIVTYNSARYIGKCLESVLDQRGAPMEILVVDNASSDETLRILESYAGRIRLFRNERNTGFAAAQNQAIRASAAEWVLTLNPDVLLRPGFLRRLLDAGERDPGAGAVCGKLFSIGPGFQPLAARLIDSTGLYFTPAMRHFDRGWHEPDGPHFSRPEYVFGASAAAALYRRAMIEDVSIDGHFFDPDFFCYREDADIAWRAQLLGWRCIYTPSATAYHVRSFVPGNRRSVSPAMNMHSVKNRFLLRIKNATPGLYRRHWASMTARDLVVMAGCLFYEPSSLEAFLRLAQCLPRALRSRRAIMARRRADDRDLAEWFASRPASRPLNEPPGASPALLAPIAS
jgi:GT2 family glycosyltransferase